ncbi:MAG TPA: hypothetical protein VK041_09875 [Opitutales bacterium]|nr:hypothetical protein [Opitutales bacterium]
MRVRRRVRRFYLLVGGAFLLLVFYFFAITFPLVRMERQIDADLEIAMDLLADAGHGMSRSEVEQKAVRLQNEIESFDRIASDPSRTIEFPPEVEMMLRQPFQLIDFDGRKFVTLDNIRNRAGEQKVKLFDDWESQFPDYTGQPPRRIWAQLTVMDQLMRTAIDAGVQRIDFAELVLHPDEKTSSGSESDVSEEVIENEIAVHMRLIGEMKAIHRLILMLPLNGEELKTMEIERGPGEKSAFFLSRFILRKSSAENPDEVEINFIASGFLDTGSGWDPTF